MRSYSTPFGLWLGRGALFTEALIMEHSERFLQIVDYDNLFQATLSLAKDKSTTMDYVRWCANLEENIISLQNSLVWGTWEPAPTYDFFVTEPKLRPVAYAGVRDTVLQNAILRVILKDLVSYQIDRSYASMKGRGPMKAVLGWQQLLRSAIGRWGFDFYIVSGDARKFYQTISLTVVKEMTRRIIPEEDINHIIDQFLDSYVQINTQGLFPHEGLAIGNVINQHLANLNGAILDHFVVDNYGIGRNYIRYMDDFRAAVHTKEEAKALLAAIDEIVVSRMHQELNTEKSHYRHFKGWDDFCGYRVFPHHLGAIPKKVKRHNRRIIKKTRQYLEGKISAEHFEASVNNGIDYMLKTGAKSNVLDNAVSLLVSAGIDNRAFIAYREGRF